MVSSPFQSKSISRYTCGTGYEFSEGVRKKKLRFCQNVIRLFLFRCCAFFCVLGLEKSYANFFFLLKGKHGRGGRGLRSARPTRPQGGDRARYPASFVRFDSFCLIRSDFFVLISISVRRLICNFISSLVSSSCSDEEIMTFAPNSA